MDKPCMKCNEEGSVLLRGKDSYCDKCFLVNIIHKVRSSLGKNKLLRSHETVLLALSGGRSSTVMLDIIHDAMRLDTHKRLRIEAICIHVLGCESPSLPIEQETKTAKEIVQSCEKLGFQVYIAHLSDYDGKTCLVRTPNTIPILNDETVKKLNDLLASSTYSARIDYISKIKRNIFVEYAEKLKCDYIFVADTAVTIASNMLSGIAAGRGEQVEHEMGFCDSRNKINILRPMKDISVDEICNYIEIKKLDVIQVAQNSSNSIQSTVQSFVLELQDNFSATVSTVCKIADKISSQSANRHVETQKLCAMCESPLQNEQTEFTALQATNFSRAISCDPQEFNNEEKVANHIEYKNVVFPLIDDVLCYGCSRTHSEIKNSTDYNMEE